MDKRASFFKSFVPFLCGVMALLAFRWLLLEPYVIPSGSMIPTLLIHDHIVVNKMAFGVRWPFTTKRMLTFSEPERGDIIVFKGVEDDRIFMIKRVVGLPGDTLYYDQDGQLFINEQPVPRRTLNDVNAEGYYAVNEGDLGTAAARMKFFEDELGGRKFRNLLHSNNHRWSEEPVKIPESRYFVMGDNRDNSKDSRYWGFVPEENLMGRAMFVWLSCEKTLSFAPFLCSPMGLRWKRFFHEIE